MKNTHVLARCCMHSPSIMLVMTSAGLLRMWVFLLSNDLLMYYSKMVVAPLVHLDDLDVDLNANVESICFDRIRFC